MLSHISIVPWAVMVSYVSSVPWAVLVSYVSSVVPCAVFLGSLCTVFVSYRLVMLGWSVCDMAVISYMLVVLVGLCHGCRLV